MCVPVGVRIDRPILLGQLGLCRDWKPEPFVVAHNSLPTEVW